MFLCDKHTNILTCQLQFYNFNCVGENIEFKKSNKIIHKNFSLRIVYCTALYALHKIYFSSQSRISAPVVSRKYSQFSAVY